MSASHAASSGTAHPAAGIEGREAAPALRAALAATAVASAAVGLVLYLLAGWSSGHVAWRPGSPMTAALLGAGFLGAVPMLLHAATRLLWEEVRVTALAAAVVVLTLLGVSLGHLGAFELGGDLVAMASSWLWLLGVAGLGLAMVVGLLAQLREPALPLPRHGAFPRWSRPLVGLEGSALLGLGAGLLLRPTFWGPLLPWRAGPLDDRMIAAWCLALGVALLGALAEDDPRRLRGGLAGLATIAVLALVGVAWHHADVDLSQWPGRLLLVLLAGLSLTGVVGLALERGQRASGSAAVTR